MDSLRQKLIGLINATKRKKPYRCECEYVESTEKDAFFPLFTTDGSVDETTTWEIRLSFNDVSFTGQLMGYGYAGSNRYNLGVESNRFRFAYSTNWFDAAITTPDTNPHTWRLEPTSKTTANAYIDEQVTSTTASSDFSANSWFIGVGGRSMGNNQIQTGNQFGWKLYYSKIWKAGKLVVDVIPVIDWDDKPCLYDKISGKLIYATIRNTAETGGTYATITAGREIHRVEYLESTGTQYINTGYSFVKSTDEIELNYMITEFGSSYSWGFGSLESGATYGISGVNSTNGCRFSYGTTTSNFSLDTQSTTQHYLVMNDSGMYNDNVQVKDGSGVTINGTWNNYLYALSYNASGGVSYYAKERIWGYKHKRNGSYLRDMYPAIDENGLGFMFDRVTHTIFDNQGTGIGFKYPLVEVEYLESDGTQYINTGLLSTADSKVDAEFSFTTMESGVANNLGVFGGRDLQTSHTFTLFKIASATPQYFRFDFNGQPQVGTSDELTWNTDSKYRFQYDGTNCITTNTTTGESVVKALSPAVTFTTSPICLFAVNTKGTMGQFLSGRIYKYWYTDGTNTIKLVPAIKDGKGCMYDKITGTVYENLGTGDFIVGRIKEK